MIKYTSMSRRTGENSPSPFKRFETRSLLESAKGAGVVVLAALTFGGAVESASAKGPPNSGPNLGSSSRQLNAEEPRPPLRLIDEVFWEESIICRTDTQLNKGAYSRWVSNLGNETEFYEGPFC